MHIPDGFLTVPVWAPLAAASVGVVTFAAHRTHATLDQERVPLMGVMGAFVFAAQMINVPVAGGTSGHLLGSVLLAVLLGPHVATLVMASVFVVQCFLFQDGGFTSLGANLFNMGIVGTYGGYYLYRGVRLVLPRRPGSYAAVMLACWLSVVGASVLVAVELSLSGIVAFVPCLIAMAGVHALIGLFEGAITVAVLSFLVRVRPDLLPEEVSS